jgi:hypothetical protein
VSARAVIVTASTAVIAAGKIKFKPNLPAPYARAFETLKLGNYDHVAIEFSGNLLGVEANEVIFDKVHDSKPAALLANLHGTRLSILKVPGKSGAELSERGESAMLDFAQGRQSSARMRPSGTNSLGPSVPSRRPFRDRRAPASCSPSR